MQTAYFLSGLENFALWILFRSRRIGFIAVKEMNSCITWYYKNPMDITLPDDPFEPPHHYFERLYHAPSYGEEE